MKRSLCLLGLFVLVLGLLPHSTTLVQACSCSRPITLQSTFEQDYATAAVIQVTLDEEVIFKKPKGKQPKNVFAYEQDRVFLATARVAYKANGLVDNSGDDANNNNNDNPNAYCQAMDEMLQPEAGLPLLVRTPVHESLCGVTSLQAGTEWVLFGSLTLEKKVLQKARKFKKNKAVKKAQRRFKNRKQARKFLKRNRNKKLIVLDVGLCAYQEQVQAIGSDEMLYLQAQRNCRCGNVADTCGALPEFGLCPDNATPAGAPEACVYDKMVDTCTWGPLSACPTCTADWQCIPGEQYCAAGYCRAMGTCDSVWDCENPSNEYATTACIGFPTCDEGGICGKDCNDGCQCPPTNDEETCGAVADCGGRDPCRDSSCFVYGAQCVTNRCGVTCTAVWYAPNGDPVDCTT